MTKKISYHSSVDYSKADPAKVLAQKAGLTTAKNLPFGFSEVTASRGESAYVFDMGTMYGALVQEGLGTKSLIAQTIYNKSGKSFFESVAKDTVATFVNDLISVGATPVVANAYWSSSSYDWLADNHLTKDFINGWRAACDEAKIVWGGGETQSLPGIINNNALEFAGSAFGIIRPKKQLVSHENLRVGDKIILIESSGVHANGISLVREIANTLKDGYDTRLPDKSSFGETVLTPTHLYSTVVRELFNAKLNIHYLSNITGHGWRKLMRANGNFTYHMEFVPPYPVVFDFIAKQSGNDQVEMYGNYNMGAGYAVYLPVKDVSKAQKIIAKTGLKSWVAGTVKKGPKQVIIEPKNIIYSEKALSVRL